MQDNHGNYSFQGVPGEEAYTKLPTKPRHEMTIETPDMQGLIAKLVDLDTHEKCFRLIDSEAYIRGFKVQC